MKENVEKIGVCKSKRSGYTTLFHRVHIKQSRFYRVWTVPGVDDSIVMHPDDYMSKYETVDYKTTREAKP